MSSNDRDRLADALAGMGNAPTPGAAGAAKPQAAGEMQSSSADARGAIGALGARAHDGASGAAVNDDDVVAAPAPDATVFAARQSTAALVARQRIERKRTLIPVLLTSGVLLPAIASLKWLAGPDTVFAEMELWVLAVMAAAGVMLLGVAALNMMQVRHELAAARGRRR